METTNFERIKQMNIEELSLFLMKVNCVYDMECMIIEGLCKHPKINNNCSICFKEWLESEVDENG